MILVHVSFPTPYLRYLLTFVFWLLKRTFKFVIILGHLRSSYQEAALSYGLSYLIDKKAYRKR